MNTIEPTAPAPTLTRPATPVDTTPRDATPTPTLTRSATAVAAIPRDATPAHPDTLAALLAESAPSAGLLDELESDRLSPAGRVDAVVASERLVRHAQADLIRRLGTMTHHTADHPGSPSRDAGDQPRTPTHDIDNQPGTPTHDVDNQPGTPTRDVDNRPGTPTHRDTDRRSAPSHDTLDANWLVESELCAALAWSPSAVQSRLAEAEALVRLFPETLRLLSEGRISLEQARCLAQLTFGLSDATAQAVQARVLDRMPGQSVSITRQAVRRAILRVDPAAAEQRHAHERKRRRVELIPEDDGMATLSFYVPAEVAAMAMRTLTALAQQAKRTNVADTRTLDQHRADLLPALLLRGAPGLTTKATPHITVVAGVETLLGLSREPGHLDGYGPIDAEQTRRIAHDHGARWRFLLTATDGTPAAASRTYTPTAAIKHLTQLKHTTCAFPHCHMPADRCDLDHNHPFGKGGATAVDNLAPLCRRHHEGKTRGHWKLTRNADTITWTSTQTGRSYTAAPTRYDPAPVAA